MHIIIAVALRSMAQGLYWLFDKHIRHHRWCWHTSRVWRAEQFTDRFILFSSAQQLITADAPMWVWAMVFFVFKFEATQSISMAVLFKNVIYLRLVQKYS